MEIDTCRCPASLIVILKLSIPRVMKHAPKLIMKVNTFYYVWFANIHMQLALIYYQNPFVISRCINVIRFVHCNYTCHHDTSCFFLQDEAVEFPFCIPTLFGQAYKSKNLGKYFTVQVFSSSHYTFHTTHFWLCRDVTWHATNYDTFNAHMHNPLIQFVSTCITTLWKYVLYSQLVVLISSVIKFRLDYGCK